MIIKKRNKTNNNNGIKNPMLNCANRIFIKKNAKNSAIAGTGDKNNFNVDCQSPSLGPAVIEHTIIK